VKTGDFLKRLDRVTVSGKGWKARCPAHDDTTPSLSIAEGDDGRILVWCFAGCAAKEITSALGLRLADLMPERQRGKL
jgi:putative DNA primase/helicase